MTLLEEIESLKSNSDCTDYVLGFNNAIDAVSAIIQKHEALDTERTPQALTPEQREWQPIETLKLNQFHGYAVSDTVLLAVWFDETGITRIRSGRVWEENGKRSLPDNKHDVYERVTHWMLLPAAPDAEKRLMGRG
jgi:hypothetical protein